MPSLAARARDVLTSEWTKLRSVRSTYWTLLIAAVTAIGGSAILAYSNAHVPRGGSTPFDPVASIFVAWLECPVLAVGILGVLAFTSEYSTGQIAGDPDGDPGIHADPGPGVIRRSYQAPEPGSTRLPRAITSMRAQTNPMIVPAARGNALTPFSCP